MFTPKHVLVPVDFSDVSHAAVNAGLQLAAAHLAELMLLSVEEGMDHDIRERIVTAPDDTVIEDRIRAGEQALEEVLRQERARCDEAGLALPWTDVRIQVSGGQWLDVILHEVADKQVDVVVIGTHGREKGVKGLFLSSISERLVARAGCSVFVVKPDGFPYLRD